MSKEKTGGKVGKQEKSSQNACQLTGPGKSGSGCVWELQGPESAASNEGTVGRVYLTRNGMAETSCLHSELSPEGLVWFHWTQEATGRSWDPLQTDFHACQLGPGMI